MSSWTPADSRELTLIRRTLEHLRDLYAASLEPAASPSQLAERCEHAVCCLTFGGTPCATCPDRPTTTTTRTPTT